MTAKEELLETIRLWIASRPEMAGLVTPDRWDRGYAAALDDLTELLDAL